MVNFTPPQASVLEWIWRLVLLPIDMILIPRGRLLAIQNTAGKKTASLMISIIVSSNA